MSELASILRSEAENCRLSAVNNGEYNTPFWVAGIILDRLAEALGGETASPESGSDNLKMPQNPLPTEDRGWKP